MNSKDKDPKSEPWDIPARADSHDDVWPFKTAFWKLFSQKLFINLRSERFIPMHVIS